MVGDWPRKKKMFAPNSVNKGRMKHTHWPYIYPIQSVPPNIAPLLLPIPLPVSLARQIWGLWISQIQSPSGKDSSSNEKAKQSKQQEWARTLKSPSAGSSPKPKATMLKPLPRAQHLLCAPTLPWTSHLWTVAPTGRFLDQSTCEEAAVTGDGLQHYDGTR